MRRERDHARAQPRRPRGVDHGAMAAVHAVERADRDRALGGRCLARRAQDVHTSTVSGRAIVAVRDPDRDEVALGDERDGAFGVRRNGTARRDGARALLVQVDPRQVRHGGERSQNALLVGVLDAERPDLGAAQRRAVPAERVGDRADVRPGRNSQVEVEGWRLEADDLERVDGRAAHRHLDGDAAPMQAVGALAVDLHRRRRRDRQLDLAAQRLDVGERRDRRRLELGPLHVAGVGAHAELDRRQVALVEPDEVAREPRGAADEADEQPGRERVERPGVPGLQVEAVANAPHDLERGRPGLLVHEHEPAGRVRHSSVRVLARIVRHTREFRGYARSGGSANTGSPGGEPEIRCGSRPLGRGTRGG